MSTRQREPIRDLGLKILALVLAVVMWFYITKGLGLERNVEEQVFKNVEVKVLVAGEGNFLAKVTPRKIELRLRGEKNALKSLEKNKVLAFVDASTFEAGKYERIPVTLDLPLGVKAARKPPVCEVMLEKTK